MTSTPSTQAQTGSVKTATPAAEFSHRLAQVAETVETFLVERLGPEIGPGEIARPPRLMDAMRHAVLGGGKRLRPFLAIETARMLGGSEAAALAAGAGVELVHCYSLVHDDLPAMDDDDMRRGKPTVHKAYDEATAILVGDALQTLAFEIVADPTWQPDARIRADLVLGLARASGLGGMVGGQLLDLTAEGRFGAANMDVDDTLRMQAMKTGAILAFSVEAGAIVGGADAGQRAALLRYGLALGQAFQIADDILDREASPEAMGKATGKDKDAGKATLVDRLGLDGARAECDRLVGVCEDAVAPWGEGARTLRDAARFTVARKT
ncbi:farnesyl diphosphate synthase [Methylobacterium brachiatum]|uniref:Probable farnesyl diphosphate synthase n=1 Tax=Methylobacterium brachiatum TaxID=269660 RepID=A0AAJ1TIF2_9HYPH|nr:farnesyl diphosphate synthase [Methylobacterium brachiatum]MCB4801031.1 polyprenyl synthetase family protein [Methylobacterium brachiatum]MDQ0541201.1 farnesyl diphosphate synthase [Methylobacterium brachiatum]